MQDFHCAVMMLDQRGASLDPVTVVVIVDALDLAHLGAVDVAADDPVEAALPRLRLRGLMAIPAPTPDFNAQRQAFARLRIWQEQLNASGLALDTLSIGMSDDLEAAVAEGATLVRIGAALFGPRS